jgi:hypothetical protein
MYSLALIIFVVSEKKAFEHFPIGSNVVNVFYADRKSKVAAIAGHRLTLDPMGKCSNAFSETTNMIKAKLGRSLKCEKFTDDKQQTTDDRRQVMAIVHLDLWSR